MSEASGRAKAALESQGLRCTRQRLAVFERLLADPDHPTAEDLFRAVRAEFPQLSLATVYNALEALVACGLAEKLAAGPSGAARFDARMGGHYHARCLKSGQVFDVEGAWDPDLLAKLDPALMADLLARGFRVTGYRLELVGFADECAG